MGEFNTDRFCIIAGDSAAVKIDSYDDGNPDEGAFRKHPLSEKGTGYVKDIYCAYYSDPAFGDFQTSLLNPEEFFAKWRTPDKEDNYKAADMLNFLDNVANPDKLVIRIPAGPRTTTFLTDAFPGYVSGTEEFYPGTDKRKIKFDLDKDDIPPELQTQLKLYANKTASRFVSLQEVGAEYVYRSGYFNLYDLSLQGEKEDQPRTDEPMEEGEAVEERIGELMGQGEASDKKGSREEFIRMGAAAVPSLADALAYDEEVAFILEEMDETALPALIEALSHTNPVVRANILWVLTNGSYTSRQLRRHKDTFVELLDDPDIRVRLEAAHICDFLSIERKKVTLIVRDALSNQDDEIRRQAALHAGFLKVEEALEKLVDLARGDDSVDVRVAATEALGEYLSRRDTWRRARFVLLELADDSEEEEKVRQAALYGLDRVNDYYQTIFIDALKKDPSALVRRQAAWALADEGDQRTIPVLIKQLKKDDSHLVREAIIDSLVKLRATSARETLEWVAENDLVASVREAARQAALNLLIP